MAKREFRGKAYREFMGLVNDGLLNPDDTFRDIFKKATSELDTGVLPVLGDKLEELGHPNPKPFIAWVRRRLNEKKRILQTVDALKECGLTPEELRYVGIEA